MNSRHGKHDNTGADPTIYLSEFQVYAPFKSIDCQKKGFQQPKFHPWFHHCKMILVLWHLISFRSPFYFLKKRFAHWIIWFFNSWYKLCFNFFYCVLYWMFCVIYFTHVSGKTKLHNRYNRCDQYSGLTWMKACYFDFHIEKLGPEQIVTSPSY